MFNPQFFFESGRVRIQENIFQIDTTIAGMSNNLSIYIPVSESFFGTVDWGDGNTQTYSNVGSSTLNHSYSIGGVKTIKIKVNPGYFFKLFLNNVADKNKFIKMIQYGSGFKLGASAFYGALNFDLSSAVDYPKNIDNSLNNCFRGFPFSIIKNIEKIDVSQVTNMAGAFLGSGMNQDISAWNFNKNVILQNFLGIKTPANYSASNYSALLNKINVRVVGVGRTETNKNFGNGTIKYDSTGIAARSSLISDSWTVVDGGLV